MKRKVVQHGLSTLIISLPSKWVKEYNVKKGDELEVEEEDSSIVISSERRVVVERAELNIDGLDPMVLRYMVALYKKGVDEIEVTFGLPEEIRVVQEAIGKEAVGYEITDQTTKSCIIRHVSGELEEFEPVLKRTFLLLLTMADQTYDAFVNGEFEDLKNAAFLEEANNRFTTTCRRLINKKGPIGQRKTGPIYCIIEELENIADQYKYLCNYFYEKKDKNPKFSKDALTVLKSSNEVLRRFFEVFYKYDRKKIVEIGKGRKNMVKRAFSLIEKSKNANDIVLLHYALTIMQKVFCLVGPYLVMVV